MYTNKYLKIYVNMCVQAQQQSCCWKNYKSMLEKHRKSRKALNICADGKQCTEKAYKTMMKMAN